MAEELILVGSVTKALPKTLPILSQDHYLLKDVQLTSLLNREPDSITLVGHDRDLINVVNSVHAVGEDIPVKYFPVDRNSDLARRLASRTESAPLPALYLADDHHSRIGISYVELGIGETVYWKARSGSYRLLPKQIRLPLYFYSGFRECGKFSAKLYLDDDILMLKNLNSIVVGFGNTTVSNGTKIFPKKYWNNFDQVYVLVATDLSWKAMMNLSYQMMTSKLRPNKHLSIYPAESLKLVQPSCKSTMTVDGLPWTSGDIMISKKFINNIELL